MDNLFNFLCYVVATLIAMDVFEFTKALASTLQGDTLPKMQKRLTLNPFRHFEPVGFLLFLFCRFGWGKPVETSKRMYKDMKTGELITYLSPMVVSLAIVFALKFVMGIVIIAFGTGGWVHYFNVFMTYLRQCMVILVLCNLVPVPPMCGSKILCCFLSPNGQVSYAQNERIYQTVFIFFMLIGLTEPIIIGAARLVLSII